MTKEEFVAAVSEAMRGKERRFTCALQALNTESHELDEFSFAVRRLDMSTQMAYGIASGWDVERWGFDGWSDERDRNHPDFKLGVEWGKAAWEACK